MAAVVMTYSVAFETVAQGQDGSGVYWLVESFKNDAAPGWVFRESARLTSGVVDQADDGWLRLTGNDQGEVGFAYLDAAFASSSRLRVSFDHAAWGGWNGADGLAFVLFDGETIDPQPAPGPGASLGYASDCRFAGLTNAYLGIGIDEWGSFADHAGCPVGGPFSTGDFVTVRGAGNGTNGYQYLTHAEVNQSLDSPRTLMRPSQTGPDFHHFVITLSSDKKLTVQMEFGADSMLGTLIDSFDVGAAPGQGEPPPTFKLGFTAATGGSTNYHEIRNLEVLLDCGDDVLQDHEECDDGNMDSSDGCTNDCTICGNGEIARNESCDDGNRADGDSCDSNCTPTGCGNRIIANGEECDDGNVDPFDACTNDCTVCGNGFMTEPEQCDDGNLVDGDGCDADCTVERCGNGIISGSEECDDGNQVDGDGCDANCRFTFCLTPLASHEPLCNPQLAGSEWPTFHRTGYNQASSPFPGPEPGVDFLAEHLVLSGSPITLSFTEEYPDGGRTVWGSLSFGGAIAKLDHDSFELIDVYIPAEREEEAPSYLPINSSVNAIDRDNNLIVGRDHSIEVYSENFPGVRWSSIELVKRFYVPQEVFCRSDDYVFGMALLHDGYVAFVTRQGVIGVIPRFPESMTSENLQFISLNGAACDNPSISTNELERVLNSLAVDEDGGIYVVTTTAAEKLVWDGGEIRRSWRTEYEKDEGTPGVRLSEGSGSNPTLMGTSYGDDRFVVITDAQELMHLVLLWRNEIPTDWNPIGPGRDPRIACEIPVTFGDPTATRTNSEQSVLVRGYSAVVVNNELTDETFLEDIPQVIRFAFAALEGGNPELAPVGLERIDWNPETRRCTTRWVNDTVSIPNAIPTMSDATGLIYGVGQRGGIWGLEGVDFDTGESRLFLPSSFEACTQEVLESLGPFAGAFEGVLERLPGNCENSFLAATQVGPDGTIYSGTFQGVSKFTPESVVSKPFRPQAVAGIGQGDSLGLRALDSLPDELEEARKATKRAALQLDATLDAISAAGVAREIDEDRAAEAHGKVESARDHFVQASVRLDSNVDGARDEIAAARSDLVEALEVMALPGCAGDCDDNGDVLINELVTIVNVALDVLPLSKCGDGDADGDGRITVDEAVLAVANALSGCPLLVLRVTKTEDTADGMCDEDCSLREAIITANAGPRAVSVTLPAGNYVLTLVGANEDAAATGDLDITEDLTLIGAGTEKTFIDGNATDRILHLLGGTTRISGVTISNGQVSPRGGAGGGLFGAGGGVFVEQEAALEMSDSAVSENVAGTHGGGIWNSGSMKLTETMVRDNLAGGPFFGGVGGGISNHGPAELTGIVVQDNWAFSGAGAIDNLLPSSEPNAGKLVLKNSTVSGNTAELGLGGIGNGQGTAELANCTVSNHTGGGIFNDYRGTLLVADSSVTENGTGIINHVGAGTLTVTRSTVSHNSSDGIVNGATTVVNRSMVVANLGRGVSNERSAAFTANESVISGNSGRGIENGILATVDLVDSTVADNSDGGIKNAPVGTVTLENCTVSGNSSEFGGGLYNPEDGTAVLKNTTLSGNTATQGGGIFNTFGEVELTHCTLSDNAADDLGGGILSLGTTNLTGSIVANSRSGRNCDGMIVSGGHNLDDDGSCGLVAEGDLSNVAPYLAPLGDYGGPTATHALCIGPSVPDASCMAASPALEAADGDICPATDQRGVERPQPPGGVCDMGAYEAD